MEPSNALTSALTDTVNLSRIQAAAARQKALLQVAQEKVVSDPSASGVSASQMATMKQKAKEFESFYIYQTLELMQPKNDSVMNGGIGEEMFQHQINEEMAKNMANNGGFGLSDAVYRELVRQQAAQSHTATP